MSAYVPIDYTSKDWLAFRNHMLDAARLRVPEWTSRSPNDFGVVLIELFAYAADILSFYGDRIAGEAFLRTAVQRKSVLDIARMLGYTPASGVPAKVELEFTVAPGNGTIFIPKCTRVGTRATTSDDIVYFELDEDLYIDSDATTTGTVEATEGESHDLEPIGTSDATPNQRFQIPYSPVLLDTVRVFVDEGAGPTLWRGVTNLVDTEVGEATYQVLTDEFGVSHIQFGDNVHGRIPTMGAQVYVSYRVGGGVRGNVPENTLTFIVNHLPGVVSVTNPAPATGGADPESLSSIRENAPRALRTLERAVSLQDYADLPLSFPGVAKANAEQGSGREAIVYVAPVGGGTMTSGMKSDLQAFLDERKMLDVTVTLRDPDYIPIDIDLTLVVKDNYVQDLVEAAVRRSLQELLAFNNVDFAQRVTLASVYRAAQRVDGVEYVVITSLDADDARNSGDAADVVLTASEIPQAGTITFNTSGGLT